MIETDINVNQTWHATVGRTEIRVRARARREHVASVALRRQLQTICDSRVCGTRRPLTTTSASIRGSASAYVARDITSTAERSRSVRLVDNCLVRVNENGEFCRLVRKCRMAVTPVFTSRGSLEHRMEIRRSFSRAITVFSPSVYTRSALTAHVEDDSVRLLPWTMSLQYRRYLSYIYFVLFST